MKPKRSIKKYGKIRRILVTVLLFTFCSISLLSQKPDSLTGDPDALVIPLKEPGFVKPGLDTTSRKDWPKSPEYDVFGGQDFNPAVETQLPQQLVDDSITGAEILADSTNKKELEEGHSARKAMIYSIVLPGLGQAYNKKYWKIPIVYAALGGAGYAIYYNLGQYRIALDEYAIAYAQSPSADDRYVKYFRRNLELSIIGIVAVDALAVVDAYVDANLFYWDVDPDLTLRVEPSIQPFFNASGTMRNNYGIKCSLTF